MSINYKLKSTFIVFATLVCSLSLKAQTQPAAHQEHEDEEEVEAPAAKDNAEELAKKLANPVANLISVPFQNNTDYGIGSSRGSRNTLNFQPVIPVKLTANANLIARCVLPFVSQYNITGEGQGQNGLGDAVVSAFISPSHSKGITWGVGPVFLVPTGTNDVLTGKKFGIGPTALLLTQTKGFTIGALVNQIWTVAGSEERDNFSQMFVQPFVTYNWKSGAGLGGMFEWTQNWTANTSNIFFIPTVSGVTSLGKQKVSLAVGPRLNIVAPSGSRAEWGWRAVVIFVFPK